MNFDVERFRNEVLSAKNKEEKYLMKTVDPPAEFKLKPRTVARVERVLSILDEDRERRQHLIEALEKGKLPDPEKLPESDFEIKWRVFKEITEGDHNRIEENLKEYMDLSVVESAIFDFFAMFT